MCCPQCHLCNTTFYSLLLKQILTHYRASRSRNRFISYRITRVIIQYKNQYPLGHANLTPAYSRHCAGTSTTLQSIPQSSAHTETHRIQQRSARHEAKASAGIALLPYPWGYIPPPPPAKIWYTVSWRELNIDAHNRLQAKPWSTPISRLQDSGVEETEKWERRVLMSELGIDIMCW